MTRKRSSNNVCDTCKWSAATEVGGPLWISKPLPLPRRLPLRVWTRMATSTCLLVAARPLAPHLATVPEATIVLLHDARDTTRLTTLLLVALATILPMQTDRRHDERRQRQAQQQLHPLLQLLLPLALLRLRVANAVMILRMRLRRGRIVLRLVAHAIVRLLLTALHRVVHALPHLTQIDRLRDDVPDMIHRRQRRQQQIDLRRAEQDTTHRTRIDRLRDEHDTTLPNRQLRVMRPLRARVLPLLWLRRKKV